MFSYTYSVKGQSSYFTPVAHLTTMGLVGGAALGAGT
jgi:hypothetical protein